jgi:hypothetical protein
MIKQQARELAIQLLRNESRFYSLKLISDILIQAADRIEDLETELNAQKSKIRSSDP